MYFKIAFTCIALVLLCTIATDALNMCTFRPPREDVDWDRVSRISWNWAAHTIDDWHKSLTCSKVAIQGDGEGVNSSFTIDMMYGASIHQTYTLSGKYVNTSEYHMKNFEFSWKNIVAYVGSNTGRRRIVAQDKDSLPRKSNAMFYTDYRNYFITAICLPSGRVSVFALTPHQRATRLLLKRIYGVLRQYSVLAIPARINCRFVNNNKNGRNR